MDCRSVLGSHTTVLFCFFLAVAVLLLHTAYQVLKAPELLRHKVQTWSGGSQQVEFERTPPVAVDTLCDPIRRPAKSSLERYAARQPAQTGVVGRRYGRGISLVDIDGDGDDDIWLCDGEGTHKQHDSAKPAEAYRNVGGGKFEPWPELTEFVPSTEFLATWGSVWFDFDRDGDLDLVPARGGYEDEAERPPVLFENRCAGSSACRLHARGDLFDLSRVGPSREYHVSDRFPMLKLAPNRSFWSYEQKYWGVAPIDYDRDGWLDLIMTVTNAYPDEAMTTSGMRFWALEGRPWVLWRNDRGRRLVDVTEDALPFEAVSQELKNPVVLDVDRDGWPDLFLAGSPSLLYHNDHGVFRYVKPFQSTDVRDSENAMLAEFGMIFSACAADFNQDGRDDLYLGAWNGADLVLLGNGADRGFTIGSVARKAWDKHASIRTSQYRMAPPFENTMGLGCGDFTHDGFPDAIIGTGTPNWGNYDIALCNLGNASGGGWLGLARCDQCSESEKGVLRRGHGEPRTHGIALGDLDQDGRTEIVFSLGGFALADRQGLPEDLQDAEENWVGDARKEGGDEAEADEIRRNFVENNQCEFYDGAWTCDNRDRVVIYSDASALEPTGENMAWVRLRSRIGVREALGARLLVSATEPNGAQRRRHLVVRSTQAFGSQNSEFLPVSLGHALVASVAITWPDCSAGSPPDVREVRAGDRVTFELDACDFSAVQN